MWFQNARAGSGDGEDGSLRAPRSAAPAATAANEQGAACCWAHSLRPWCPFAAGLLVFLHGDGSYAVTDVGDVKRRRGGRRRRVATPSAARGAAAAARPMIADGDQLMGVLRGSVDVNRSMVRCMLPHAATLVPALSLHRHTAPHNRRVTRSLTPLHARCQTAC